MVVVCYLLVCLWTIIGVGINVVMHDIHSIFSDMVIGFMINGLGN
jgi:hypothetical protein